MVPMMALAAGIAVPAGVAGLYLSYYARTAGGASTAGTMVGPYRAALLATSLGPRIVSGHARGPGRRRDGARAGAPPAGGAAPRPLIRLALRPVRRPAVLALSGLAVLGTAGCGGATKTVTSVSTQTVVQTVTAPTTSTAATSPTTPTATTPIVPAGPHSCGRI